MAHVWYGSFDSCHPSRCESGGPVTFDPSRPRELVGAYVRSIQSAIRMHSGEGSEYRPSTEQLRCGARSWADWKECVLAALWAAEGSGGARLAAKLGGGVLNAPRRVYSAFNWRTTSIGVRIRRLRYAENGIARRTDALVLAVLTVLNAAGPPPPHACVRRRPVGGDRVRRRGLGGVIDDLGASSAHAGSPGRPGATHVSVARAAECLPGELEKAAACQPNKAEMRKPGSPPSLSSHEQPWEVYQRFGDGRPLIVRLATSTGVIASSPSIMATTPHTTTALVFRARFTRRRRRFTKAPESLRTAHDTGMLACEARSTFARRHVVTPTPARRAGLSTRLAPPRGREEPVIRAKQAAPLLIKHTRASCLCPAQPERPDQSGYEASHWR